MDKQRLVIAGVGLAIALVIGLGYLFGVQPQLTAASAAADQTATITSSNQASEVTLQKLKKDYANIDQFKGQLAKLQLSIPSTRSLDALLADLHVLAASTGETITGFDPSDPVAYTPPVSAAATPTATSTASPSPSPTPAPTATAPAAPTAPQAPKTTTNSLITASNFVAIPLTITVKGSTDGAIAFLGELQHGPRLVLVTGFSGTEDKSASSGQGGAAAASAVTYTVKGLVYVLSGAQPTPTPTPTPSK
ncbi:hypothetical protein ABCS02_02505 [Microbacterium sp. X-17]|uniref:hypothetical protein n=1 Tax=Microbacterium sp. X-17 TaxID=3144404 RepID=UPI0031F5274B